MDFFSLPADPFSSRAPARLRDRVPRVVDMDGKPTWVGDGAKMGAHAAWMGRGQMTTHRGRRMAEAGWQPSHPSMSTTRGTRSRRRAGARELKVSAGR